MWQIHATVVADEAIGITFALDAAKVRNKIAAMAWCRTAMRQLGYKPMDYTLSIQVTPQHIPVGGPL